MKLIVVRGGVVVGDLEADDFTEAQRLAVERFGLGARAIAPGDRRPDPPRRPARRPPWRPPGE